MAMRRDEGMQDDLIAIWSEIPRSPGHAFYDRLQMLLRDAGFDAFVDGVVPILQKRGVFRSEYEGETLRENLGLPAPVNQYVEHPERHVEPRFWGA